MYLIFPFLKYFVQWRRPGVCACACACAFVWIVMVWCGRFALLILGTVAFKAQKLPRVPLNCSSCTNMRMSNKTMEKRLRTWFNSWLLFIFVCVNLRLRGRADCNQLRCIAQAGIISKMLWLKTVNCYCLFVFTACCPHTQNEHNK